MIDLTMLDTERAYWIERCLRLEQQIAELKGYAVAPLLPKVERKSLYAMSQATASAATLLRRKQRRTTADERAKMLELTARGMSPVQIGYQLGMSDTTVRRQLHEMESA